MEKERKKREELAIQLKEQKLANEVILINFSVQITKLKYMNSQS